MLSTAACSAIQAALREARFEPAQVAGQSVAARVRVRFALAHENRPLPSQADSDAAVPKAAREIDAGAGSEYGATATVSQIPPTAHALELAEIREVPGTFGDPFRVLDSLPGVVPVMTGLPYVYVRGAPPAATAYYYDDIQLPALFHLALGPAVVHPAMIGAIDFFPGVAPARYGRKTGGVVTGQAATPTLRPGIHGELEWRLIDMQAYAASPTTGGGRVEVGARYGYPGLIAKLFDRRAVLQY